MKSSLSALAVSLLALGAVFADTPDAKEAPKAPPGWKYVEAKDQSYQFLFPAQTSRAGTRERTFRSGRFSFKAQVNYATTAGGMNYIVEALNVGGTATAGMTASDLFKLVADAEKAEGFATTELTPVTLGKLIAHELFATADGEARRVVMTGGRQRLYVLTASGKDKEAVSGKDADTFLGSFVVNPKPVVAKADPNTPAKPDAAEKGDATSMPAWTLDLAKMTYPDGPARGKILGAEFKLEKVERHGAYLTLRQGAAFHPDLAVELCLFVGVNDSLAGKKFVFGPKHRGSHPHVTMKRILPGETLPTSETALNGYALKLEFGEAADGKVPGKIYVCTPDRTRCVVAGTFEVDQK